MFKFRFRSVCPAYLCFCSPLGVRYIYRVVLTAKIPNSLHSYLLILNYLQHLKFAKLGFRTALFSEALRFV
jgi:hypothetical protein